MVEPTVNVFAAFLENLLSQNHGGRRSIRVEVILRDVATLTNCSSTIVSKVENPCFDTQPRKDETTFLE